LIASNVTTFYVTKKNLRPKRHSVESVLAEARYATGIVVIGDSLVEDAKLPSKLCGLPIINAGIGGARASNFISIAEEMTAQQATPQLIVVALGTNDSLSLYRSDFRAAYRLLIDSLPNVPLALGIPSPVSPLMSDGSRADLIKMSGIDKEIRDAAAYKRAMLIDLGTIQGFETRDGIHPTEKARLLWDRAIIDGIKRSLDCL
jgi:lysophospholipase L1-like esterase